MRGSLICNPNGTVDFVIDEGGHFEMMMSDRNKIIPYHKSELTEMVEEYNKQAKQESHTKEDTEEYVITSIRHKERNEIWKLGVGRYIHEKYLGVIFPDDEVVKKDFEIWSVKRKSDSQEFTVDELTEQGKIKEFYITPYFHFSGWEHRGDNALGVRMYDKDCFQINYITKKKDNAVMVDMDAPLLSVNEVVQIRKEYYYSDLESKLIELAKQKSKQ